MFFAFLFEIHRGNILLAKPWKLQFTVHTYLTMTEGAHPGAHFFLDGSDEYQIGRGTDCRIILTDPLCSRVHAIISDDGESWTIRDEESRNGTYVNGQKIDEARLINEVSIKVGSTEFVFRQTDYRPTDITRFDLNVTQKVIRDLPIEAQNDECFDFSSITNSEAGRDLLLLHQLSIKLLSCNETDEIIRISLDLLHDHSNASVTGFLWLSDDGSLKPKYVIPQDASEKVGLSESLTDLVCRRRRAVWINNQSTDHQDSLHHFADVICAPLIREKKTLGAIHLYLEEGRFQQSIFQAVMAIANILVTALVRARQQTAMQAAHQRLIVKSADFDELLGESKPMLDLKSVISRVARATGSVLIRGESGAGKELAARAIHKGSLRADRPLLSVNCAAMPGNLLESQLFGHKKGAFTGADKDHAGLFQQADSGTLFLDEIGEMTLEGQAKLLRILEGHPFYEVGGTQDIRVDVRVIAATNRDLSEYVREKKFREDLYYRLSVFELLLPPLRDRGSDIEMLLDHFLDHFKTQHGRPDLKLSDEARRKMLSYQWPGNVRQLRNVIDSAVVLADKNVIQKEDLGLRDAGGGGLDTLRIEDWERKLIAEALSRTAGNVPEAAKLLGIGRATLYRKIEEYDISR